MLWTILPKFLWAFSRIVFRNPFGSVFYELTRNFLPEFFKKFPKVWKILFIFFRNPIRNSSGSFPVNTPIILSKVPLGTLLWQYFWKFPEKILQKKILLRCSFQLFVLKVLTKFSSEVWNSSWDSPGNSLEKYSENSTYFMGIMQFLQRLQQNIQFSEFFFNFFLIVNFNLS